jgi:hypothetical protein
MDKTLDEIEVGTASRERAGSLVGVQSIRSREAVPIFLQFHISLLLTFSEPLILTVKMSRLNGLRF